MGLQTGDKILKIDGKTADRFETSTVNMLFADEVTVLRKGKEVTFPVNENGVADVLKANEAKAYFSPRFPVVVDSILPKSGAEIGGLTKGDKIVGINGKSIQYFDQLSDELKNLKNQEAVISVVRNNQTLNNTIKVSNDGTIGFFPNKKIQLAEFDKAAVIKSTHF